MNCIDVTIAPRELTAVLNAADKSGRKYAFLRKQKGQPTIDGEQAYVTLQLEGDDWTGPTPTIALLPDGTWTCTLDVYFG